MTENHRILGCTPIGACLSGVFGQLPAVFARGVTEASVEIRQRATTRFGPGKARSDPGR